MKKIFIFCLLIVILPIILNAQNNRNYLYKAVYDGDIEYIKEYLKNFRGRASYDGYNEASSNNDLRLLRNTIYAMHGYIFKSKDLQEYFKKFSWYKGTKENVENELNEKEKMLVRIILAMEKANPPVFEDLIGEWVMPVPASVENIGYIHFYLYKDGSIEGHNLEGGRWYLEGTTFRIIPDDKERYFPLNGGSEIKNFRIIFVEYNGKLYKSCIFFESGDKVYEPTLPIEYW